MIINEIAKLVEKINYNLVDYIVVYSKRLIYDWKLEKHMSKILVAHEHILNFDQFKIETPIIEREYVIGFIGRFTETKGIINFIESVPISLSYNSNLKFVVVGDGPLYDDIIKYLREKNIDQEVSLKGWVSHDELPKLLNSLKVLVVPSYSEGLPNVLLEAMACGTIVLSTQVGAISDVIVDSNTGFLMNNNSPETIAREICRLLSCPNLDEISNNAYFKVSREFRYGSKIKMFKKLINSVRK
jgi:glycosyltransferase involved in cell wall biosynthesis